MAEFVYIGTEPRVFPQIRAGVGSADHPAQENDVVRIPGVPTMGDAMNADLVPHDEDTRRRVELIRDQVRIADSRQFSADATEVPARSKKGRG